jgi:hypothetical protein
MSAFQAIYKYWAALLTLAVLFQIGVAGYGAFDTADKVDGEGLTIDEDSFDDSWGLHLGFGYLILLGSLVLLLLAFGARGRTRILRSLALFVLVIVQVLLAWTGAAAPYIAGFLHPINAFIILGLTAAIFVREMKSERMGAAATPPPAA